MMFIHYIIGVMKTMFAITNKDFYKTDHRRQYPEGTQMVYSNFTPRSARLAKQSTDAKDEIIWFGLQAFILDYLVEQYNVSFFNLPKELAVSIYKRRLDTSLGVDAVPIDHIEALHDLGYLPIRVKSLPEGSRVPMKVPTMTIVNTLPEFYWLTNDLETVASCELWKPSTTATIAADFRSVLTKYAEKTQAPLEFVDVQAHDFSFRGMSGRHDAAMSGMGHLTSFIGTDTIPAIDAVELYYDVDASKELIGTSVPATEHSVMCMGGDGDGEVATIKRLITELYPTGVVSIVSDTWDFFKVITEHAKTLREEILNREPNEMGLAKVVFRPDSGNPVHILTGYKVFDKYTFEDANDALDHANDYPQDTYDYEVYKLEDGTYINFRTREIISEHEVKGAVECLWDEFGGTETSIGYKVLHERVGLIYGDSITIDRAETILQRLADKGFASCNVVFGVGSYTYQYNTRDTFGFAMKATYGVVDGEGREIYKDPATDSGTKKSAKGLLRVEYEDGKFVLYDQQTPEQEEQGELKTVFENGQLVNPTTFSKIRSRILTNNPFI